MIKALKSTLQIVIIGGFNLPFKIWTSSKNKLMSQYEKKETIYEVLDDEYMATNWLDWSVDSAIFLIYPIGLLVVFLSIIFTGEFLILLSLIPLYFSTIFISIARELGGSLMLLHINVKKIEKYTREKNK